MKTEKEPHKTSFFAGWKNALFVKNDPISKAFAWLCVIQVLCTAMSLFTGSLAAFLTSQPTTAYIHLAAWSVVGFTGDCMAMTILFAYQQQDLNHVSYRALLWLLLISARMYTYPQFLEDLQKLQ